MRIKTVLILTFFLVVSGCSQHTLPSETLQTSETPPVSLETIILSTPISDPEGQQRPEETEGFVILEGMEEQTRLRLGGALGYSLYYDIERYAYTNLDGIDIFYLKNQNPDSAEAYFSVERIEGTTVAEAMASYIARGALFEEDATYSVGVNAIEAPFCYSIDETTGWSEYRIFCESNSSIYCFTIAFTMEYAEGNAIRLFDILKSIVFE